MPLRTIIDLQFDIAIPMVARPRLAAFFARSADARVRVLLAPAGFGKSLAVRAYCAGPRWIHYRVGTRGASFARFVSGFAEAVAAVAPGAQASFPRAWERALQSGSPATVLARWMCEHLAGADVDLVIDDLHDSASDPSSAEFIAEFVRLHGARRIAITARVPGLLPIPLWMATGIMEPPLDATDLRFDIDEARAFGELFGDVRFDPQCALEAAGGCPVAFAYLAAACAAGIAPATLRSFEALADRIFGNRTPRERQFLLSASLLPSLSPRLLEACGWADWQSLWAAMERDAPFMWERLADAEPRFHDRFADYVAARMADEDATLRDELAGHAVRALERDGKHADALQTAARQGLEAVIDRLLDAHGFDILEAGHVDEISEALGVLDASDATTGAIATAIRGYVDARLGRLDTSEAWFLLGLVRATTDESRVAIALYYARELMHQLREDAFEVLEPYADSTALPPALLVDVRSSLGQAYMVADRADEARLRTAQALDMLQADYPAGLRARVLARAAYVAFESDDAAGAREHALLAAPIAIGARLYDVATSLYTVLYSIAYEIDDDPTACLEHLACVRDYGMKSGTMRLDLYALVAMYELYSEFGDRERLAELDRAIHAVDVNYATPAFLESFLPARALRAGWAGDFAYAQGMLAPTAERQATPFRRALRWSEVALYAAAAGDRNAAVAALAAAERCIAEGGARTTHIAFAPLYCALACCVLGDLAGARAWAGRAEDVSIPGAERVAAFRRVVACLIASADEPGRLALELPASLAHLREVRFGGLATLIESLPPVTGVAAYRIPVATVGAAVAGVRLDALFLAAAGSVTAEPALFESLDRLWNADVDARCAVPLLARWSRPPGLDGSRGRLLAARVGEFVAARAAAPAILKTFGREDDTDAQIDALFADLERAAPLMAEHSQAVSAWCKRIARRLGLADEDIAYITRSGLIHDIGKVKTPQEILDAPRRLNDQEWTIMRDHAAEGGRMAAGIASLKPFVAVIRGHHERLDGGGYPDGLRGGAIPLATRIVTVADCFNAMIGRRAYRLPMSPMDALGELDRNRHTQFDPEVADAMIHIVMGMRSGTAAGFSMGPTT